MKLRPAQAILNELRDGRSMEELAENFHEAIAAVKQFNKPATVTLEVVITPWKGAHNLVEPPVVLTGEVKSKLPKADPEATIFFVDAEGNPTRNQTRQQEMDLRVASATAEGGQ